jgi:hypothetical protein
VAGNNRTFSIYDLQNEFSLDEAATAICALINRPEEQPKWREQLIAAADAGELILSEKATPVVNQPWSHVVLVVDHEGWSKVTRQNLARYLETIGLRLFATGPIPKKVDDILLAPEKKAPSHRRYDLLQIELEQLLDQMLKDGWSNTDITASEVMPKLRDLAGKSGSCIKAKCRDLAVQWMKASGKIEKLDMSALRQRIDRWKAKHSA